MNIIYVLELENSKYYVGKTKNLEKRLQQHTNKTASYWTNTHSFIKLIKSFHEFSPYDEDATTIDMMESYGIDNVRGGIYTQITLEDSEIKHILKIIRSKNNLCYNCGDKHFIMLCPNCKRCGRNSHNIEKCYASYHKDGYSIRSAISQQRLQEQPLLQEQPPQQPQQEQRLQPQRQAIQQQPQPAIQRNNIAKTHNTIDNLLGLIDIAPIRNIRNKATNFIERICQLNEGEIHHYYLEYGKNNKYLLTSMNFIEIKNNIITRCIPIKDINFITHKKNGMFKNDELILVMDDNTRNVIEMYEASIIDKLSQLILILKIIYY